MLAGLIRPIEEFEGRYHGSIYSQSMISRLALGQGGKIVLVVMDGLGGFRTASRGSELHEAKTPHLDRLAAEGASGIHTVVAPGITPGSGAGHLALFGYDPLEFELGRGVLSAAGIGFDLQRGDVAARLNFCTLDANGNVADRRAGRLPTEENKRLCKMLVEQLDPPDGVEMFLETEREHRGLMVLRGEGLSAAVSDTDPQQIGVPPLAPEATSPEGRRTVEFVSDLLDQVRKILGEEKANFILLRGFDSIRPIPSFKERYRLNAFAVAAYPMYAGISRILGMEVADLQDSYEDEIALVERRFGEFDFLFVHYKKTDSAGEDGDFDRKVAAIEEVDGYLPRIADLEPDVICVTGDHSTPSQMKSHSWHPVPFLMWGPLVQVDSVGKFDEEATRSGAFGHVLGRELMPLMLAAAGRLTKFGA